MRLSRTTRTLALAAALLVLGAVCVVSFHTHEDGSPRGADDCVVCQIAVGLATGLAVLATILNVILAALTRLTAQRNQAPTSRVRFTRRARAPPLPA